MKIVFIQTGGTIDKDYPHGEFDHGYGFEIGAPSVQEILPKIHAMFDYEILEVVKKDSLYLTDDDRVSILKAVQSANSDKIVITHGTDTMLKTAQVLDVVKDKVVVITGSMLPEKFALSDAKFNVGMAVAATQILASGVYIALYGRVVPWQDFEVLANEYETSRKNKKI